MTKKNNLTLVSTSRNLKQQNSYIQKKKSLLQLSKKKTSDSRFLLGLKRFLIQKRQNIQKNKSKSGGIGPVGSIEKSRLCESSKDIRKRKCNAAKNRLVSIQPSSGGSRKLKSPVRSPPVLPIQVSSGRIRKQESPAASPPALSIEAVEYKIRKRKPAKSRSIVPVQDQSSQTSEQDERDIPEATFSVTSQSRPGSATNEKKKILRKSNAVIPAEVMPSPSESLNVPVGFDRNLQPQRIIQMAELKGKFYYVMKWKGSEILDIVPVEMAKERCPQVVINFYESHLQDVHNRTMDFNESTQ